MANDVPRPTAVFTPRTVATVERATSSVVARFAEPVRSLGARTLGFIDRLIGARLFGVATPGGAAASHAHASGSFVFARPWYELAIAGSAQARGGIASGSPARERRTTDGARAASVEPHVALVAPHEPAQVAPPDRSPVLEQLTAAGAASEFDRPALDAVAASSSARSMSEGPSPASSTFAVPSSLVAAASSAPPASSSSRQAAPPAPASSVAPSPVSASSTAAPMSAPSQETARAAEAQIAGLTVATQPAPSPSVAAATPQVSPSTTAGARHDDRAAAIAMGAPSAEARAAVGAVEEGASGPSAAVRHAGALVRAPEAGAPAPAAVESRVSSEATAGETVRELHTGPFASSLPPALGREQIARAEGASVNAFVRAFAHQAWADRALTIGRTASTVDPAARVRSALDGSVPAAISAVAARGGRGELVAISPDRVASDGSTASPASHSDVVGRSTTVSGAVAPATVTTAGSAGDGFTPEGRTFAVGTPALISGAEPATASETRSAESASTPIAMASASAPREASSPALLTAAGAPPAGRGDGLPLTPAGSRSTAALATDSPSVSGAPTQAGIAGSGVSSSPPASGGATAVTPESIRSASSVASTPGTGFGWTSTLAASAPGAIRSSLEAPFASTRFVEGLVGARAAQDGRVLPFDLRTVRAAPAVEYVTLPERRDGERRVGSRSEVLVAGRLSGRSLVETPTEMANRTDVAQPSRVHAAATVGDAILPRVERAHDGRTGSGDAATAVAPAASSTLAAMPAGLAPSAAGLAMAAVSTSAVASSFHRPGAIGARAELLGATVGIRAAGVSIDFVEPERLAAMIASRGADRSSIGHSVRPLELALLQLVRGDRAVGRAASSLAGVDPASAGGSAQGASPSMASNAAGPAAERSAADVAVAVAANAQSGGSAVADLATQPVDVRSTSAATPTARAVPGTATQSSAFPSALPTPRAPSYESAIGEPRLGEEEIARRIDAVWSLIRVFPASAAAALAQANAELRALPSVSMPLVARADAASRAAADAMAATNAGATAASRSATSRSTFPGWTSAQREAAPAVGESSRSATSGSTSPGSTSAQHGAARAVGENAAARGVRGSGAPSVFVAPSGRTTVRATDRTALPDGRLPRGGYLWSRAASFTTQVGQWVPPATVAAASGGADAAAAGQPAWEGMAPVASPLVQQAFVDQSDGAGAGSSVGTAREFLATTVGAEGSRSASSMARTVPPASRPDVRAARAMLGDPGAAPLLQLVTASAGGSAASPARSASASSHNAPALSLLRPAVAPSSESSAKMLDALRVQQQHAPSDDRVTLADLTLVATASSTSQLAASHGEQNSSQAHHASRGQAGGQQGGHGQQRNPEAERLEIEIMAQHLVDELRRRMEIERERAGDNWGY